MLWARKKTKKGESDKRSVPEGLFLKCDECGTAVEAEKAHTALYTCPSCGFHFAMPTDARIELALDPGSFVERDGELLPRDPLRFTDTQPYCERLVTAQSETEQRDAFRSGAGRINDHEISVGFFDFEFMGGSMGSVVGEKVARLFERAIEKRCPALLFCASGGARMQEGILSLMQMAKTTAALSRLKAARLPYVAVLLHPTTGGVAASFAMLGDVIVAEPKALIGFAGPRVIEQTIKQKLPPGFQRAEFLQAHGMIDMVVPRSELRARLVQLIGLLQPA